MEEIYEKKNRFVVSVVRFVECSIARARDAARVEGGIVDFTEKVLPQTLHPSVLTSMMRSSTGQEVEVEDAGRLERERGGNSTL